MVTNRSKDHGAEVGTPSGVTDRAVASAPDGDRTPPRRHPPGRTGTYPGPLRATRTTRLPTASSTSTTPRPRPPKKSPEEHLNDPSLLQLVETILRGGDRDRALGIPQGNPLSPLALNVMLHHVHDRPLEGDPGFPPLLRYADNLAYLCESMPEGHLALDHVRRLPTHAGLALKGADGDPVDLRESGSASLLGFRLSLHEDRLRLDLGEDALESDLALCLTSAHDDPDPQRAARTALRGWAASHGPAFGDLTADDTETILRTAARHGFRELASREELASWCTASHARWTDRYSAALRRLGLTDEDCLFVAAPPATVRPGG